MFLHPVSPTSKFLPSQKFLAGHSSSFFVATKNILRIFSPGRKPSSWLSVQAQKYKKRCRRHRFLYFCAWTQARTGDLFLFREALYQLSYPSKLLHINTKIFSLKRLFIELHFHLFFLHSNYSQHFVLY